MIICALSFSSDVISKNLTDKTFDDVLIGIWQGNATSDDGYYKNWIHRKSKDGSYQTSFFYYKDGLYESFEKVSGTWWVIGDVLYQFEPWMANPIEYKYMQLNDGCIKYTLIKNDIDTDVSVGYSYKECAYES